MFIHTVHILTWSSNLVESINYWIHVFVHPVIVSGQLEQHGENCPAGWVFQHLGCSNINFPVHDMQLQTMMEYSMHTCNSHESHVIINYL